MNGGILRMVGMIEEATDRFEAEAVEREDLDDDRRARHLDAVAGAREFTTRMREEAAGGILHYDRDLAECRTVLRAIMLGGFLVQPTRDDILPREMARTPGRVPRYALMSADTRAELAAAFNAELRTRDDFRDE